MFESLSERLQGIFKSLRGQGVLSAAQVEAALREIRLALLEADVHFQVTKQIVDRVRARATGQDVLKSLTFRTRPSCGSSATRWSRSSAGPSRSHSSPRPGRRP